MKRVVIFIVIIIICVNVHSQGIGYTNPNDFLPPGYQIVKKIKGDLNNDALDDIVLLIQSTDNSKIFIDKNYDKIDRNRRGIIILINKKNKYELAINNSSCFSSDNEDGGVYFPPELIVTIQKGTLYVEYAHGRYGYWQYIFAYKNSDFELVGYFASNGAPVTQSEISINFSTKRKQERINTKKNAIGGDEIFKSKWSSIKMSKTIRLSEITDFDELDMTIY